MTAKAPGQHQFNSDRNADRNRRPTYNTVRQPRSKLEKAAIWGAGLAFVAAAVVYGGPKVKDALEKDKLPQPEHTGNIVRLHFDGGEGEDKIVNDLHAPGFDSSELRGDVESIEENGSSVPSTVLDVDSGLLNPDPAAEEALLSYGVTQEDLHRTPLQK